jgi:pyruvate dehydrogenase E1 component alpha subunit
MYMSVSENMVQSMPKEQLIGFYERMFLFVHLYIGQEAIAVGVCAALKDDDYITSTHRGHGHVIAKGGDVRRMMAEIYGKETGYCKGKGGSMHIADMSIGMLGANGIVCGGVPIAVGAAYGAAKIRNTDQVVAPFFGDGATNEGPFHEAVNMASAWKLPVIFVCENNLYGVGTRFGRVSSSEEIIRRAEGYGIEAHSLDGNDVLSVYETMLKSVERCRKGKGPILLECKTWRHRGHFEGENPSYLDKDEHKAWLEKDPIKRFFNRLMEAAVCTAQEIEELNNSVVSRIDEAVEFAESSPFPKPEDALSDMYI